MGYGGDLIELWQKDETVGGEGKNELSEGFCFGAPGKLCYH